MKLSERYHPERYRQAHPFARQASTIYQTLSGITTLPTYETFQAIQSLIVRAYNDEIQRIPFEKRPENTRHLADSSALAIHYASFCSHGRQVFHFNPEIAERFHRTDIDEIQLNALKFPYYCFYMSFGKQTELNLYNEGWFVDGAYISVIEGKCLQIVLTTVGSVSSQYPAELSWVVNEDKYYYLSLSLDDLEKTVSSVSDIALQKELDEKTKSLKKQTERIEFQGMQLENRRSESLKTELTELSSGYTVFRNALRLIINGLCYLSAYPDDIDFRWSEDTPEPLLEKLRVAIKPKEVQRATSKLTSMGYTKIHYCGKSFERQDPNLLGSGVEVRTHFRRGHWRNQAYGLQRSNRKLVWIMPAIVRKDKIADLQDVGHVYVVD